MRQEQDEPGRTATNWRTDIAAWLRDRDEAAARRLMEGLYPIVISVVRTRLPRRMAEEDLAQVIFIRFFEKLDQFDARAPLEHWVSRLAVNTCIDHLRAEKVRPELRWADLNENEAAALDATLAEAGTDTPDTVGAADLAARLLDSLNPEDRLVIQMMDLEGRSSEEIAEATGWNRVAIRVRAMRARRKLKKQLQHLEQQRR